MSTFDIFAVAGLVLIFILLGVVFTMPAGRPRRPKRVRPPAELPGRHKDWEKTSLKLEKHIYALREEITLLEKREKKSERELLVERDKYKKLQDKLSQERGWKEKEQADLDKKNKEIIRLKEDLSSALKGREDEHRQVLRLERELKEVTDKADTLGREKKGLESELSKLKAESEGQKEKIRELDKENAQLSKKHEENAWVAKSEYVKLERELKALKNKK